MICWTEKMLCEGLIRGVVDGQHLRGLLSLANNRRLSVGIHAFGQWVITQVLLQLLFTDSDAPTSIW
jgi:hypothetical protein